MRVDYFFPSKYFELVMLYTDINPAKHGNWTKKGQYRLIFI
jgi:hypothetical protein